MIEDYKILYVEDDPSLAFITTYNLESRGYKVFHCNDGKVALDHFKNHQFNLCILDVMLPGMDGFSLASKIREINCHVPIIFLTVKSLLEDRIAGLKTGADDFICKPFHMEELVLKIEVFKRRPLVLLEKFELVQLGVYHFDFVNLKLIFKDYIRVLTIKEARLLKFLCDRRNNVAKRDDILLQVWGSDDYFLGRSLDVFISRLRKYLNKDQSIKLENVHSVGFRLSYND